MKRLLLLTLTLLLLSACGSDIDDTGTGGESSTSSTTTTTPDDTSTTSEPDDSQRAALDEARALWAATRPDSYEFEYNVACECDGGPWRVRVDENGVGTAEHVFDGPAESDYLSIDDIFDEIEAALDVGEVPVRVEYDAELGYPSTYVWNEPELPVDGGYVVTVTSFVPNPEDADAALAQELADARARWEASGIADYDYSFTRTCFCPEEFRGPYKVSVRNGTIVSATFRGTDLREIEVLNLTEYDELVLTVDAVFDEIERGLSADALSAEYDPELGHPSDVFIDVAFNIADEEVGYTIDDLRPLIHELETCSTTGVDVTLIPQPDLPEPVASKRQAIFDAAMACDLPGLGELTDPEGFTASFGGGDAVAHWYYLETEFADADVLLELVRHLNQPYTEFGDGGDITGYTWPSAFIELEAPDGTGLPADEYEALLTLYTRSELDEMFEFIGGYVGYRIGIEPDGGWIFFVAGD